MVETKRKDMVKSWLVERQAAVQEFLREPDTKAKSKKLLALAKEAQECKLYAKSSGVQAIKQRIRGQIEKLNVMPVGA